MQDLVIRFDQIKPIAQLLSNQLKHFINIKNFYYRKNAPVLFPNFCKTKVEVKEPKPISSNRLIECISKAIGFNSYSSILAENPKYRVFKLDLTDLAYEITGIEENLYFLDLFTAIIENLLMPYALDNELVISEDEYLVFRNFKASAYVEQLSFINSLLEDELNFFNEKKVKDFVSLGTLFPSTFDGGVDSGLCDYIFSRNVFWAIENKEPSVLLAYPIAVSIVLNSCEMLINDKQFDCKNIPLSKYVTHTNIKTESTESIGELLEDIQKAVKSYFYIDLNFNDLDEELCNITLSFNAKDLHKMANIVLEAVTLDKAHKERKNKYINTINELKNTNSPLLTKLYKNTNYLHANEINEEMSVSFFSNALSGASHTHKLLLVGSIEYWLNIDDENHDSLISLSDSAMMSLTEISEKDINVHGKFSHVFNIDFNRDSIWDVNKPLALPSYIEVLSDLELDKAFLKLQVKAEIIKYFLGTDRKNSNKKDAINLGLNSRPLIIKNFSNESYARYVGNTDQILLSQCNYCLSEDLNGFDQAIVAITALRKKSANYKVEFNLFDIADYIIKTDDYLEIALIDTLYDLKNFITDSNHTYFRFKFSGENGHMKITHHIEVDEVDDDRIIKHKEKYDLYAKKLMDIINSTPEILEKL